MNGVDLLLIVVAVALAYAAWRLSEEMDGPDD